MPNELIPVPAKRSHISTMLCWFESEQDVTRWAGPKVQFPFDLESLITDTNLDSTDSFCLVNGAELLAFGQCYERLGHCHLCRLVVSPDRRGEGLIKPLLTHLIAFGTRKFEVNQSSLFVYANNKGAISAYQKYGFRLTDYPEPMPMENCEYMTYNARKPLI